ncbi:MAG: S41 family peptidase [Candidatus Thiodiazotropha sp. L084R]
MKTLNRLTQSWTLLVLTLFLFACNDSESPATPKPDATAMDVTPSSLIGVWEKSGYGQILRIEEGVIYDYQVSTNTCWLSNEYLANELDYFLVEVVLAADEKSFETKAELIPDHAHAYTFNKLENLPETCSDTSVTQATTDPTTNYEVLWDTFNDYYAFFELRGVDWNEVNDAASPMLEQIYDDESLFELFSGMLQPIGDGHIHLMSEAYGIEWNAGVAPDWYLRIVDFFKENFPEDGLRLAFEEQDDFDDFKSFEEAVFGQNYQALAAQNLENVQSYLDDLSCGVAGHICWGTTPENVGYLVIDAMQGFVAGEDDQDSIEDLDTLNVVLDEAFQALSGTYALIVDVRQNQGGQESISLAVAGRFIEEEQLTYRKQARDKDTVANLHDIYLRPTGASPYTNPVYVLTSGGTYSGAETFVLSMSQLPQVILIGEPTGGIFSDMISKELPNGWTFTLSTEIYSNLDDNVYEGIGIPVDHFVDYYLPLEILDGQDSGIEKALDLFAAQ